MQTQYAGTQYNTPAEATSAAVTDWVTACGDNGTPEECVPRVERNLEAFADEMASTIRDGDWYIPNVADADDVDVARELLQEFIAEYTI